MFTGEKSDSEKENEGRSHDLSECFRRSSLHRDMQEKTTALYAEFQNVSKTSRVSARLAYPISFLSQLYHVSRREVVGALRNPLLTVVQYVVIMLFALVVGGIYFDLDLITSSGIQNRAGATFFIVMQMVFGSINALELFIRGRVMFIHESASGFYRVSVYYFANVFCDLVLLRVVPATLYALIVYWMIGLQPGVDKFFTFYLTLILVCYVSSGMSFAISSSVDVVGVATLFLAMCYVFMMLFGGLLVNISSLPTWLQWVQYLSVFRFGINALLINEMKGLTFCETVRNVTSCIPGTSYLDDQGIDYSVWGLWQNEVAMAIMGAGFMVIGYIQLRRIPKLK